MILPQLLTLGLVLGPLISHAAIFPPDSLVKVIDAKGFKKAMKQNVRHLSRVFVGLD